MRLDLDTSVIKEAEGLRLDAYQDGAGIWTIGYGHTGPEVTRGLTISLDYAEALLEQDLAWVENAIERTVNVPLNGNQYSAVASLIYNIGAGGWSASTVLRRINAGNFTGAADAFTMWNKITVSGKKVISNGLTNRRERERGLFLQGMRETIDHYPRQGITGGEAKPNKQSKTLWMGLSGVLASIMAAWGQLKVGAPELVETLTPYLPYLLGAIFVAVMFNRWMDSRKGVH